MTVNELIDALGHLPADLGQVDLMLGVKPLTGDVALLVRREPYDDDILVWDGK